MLTRIRNGTVTDVAQIMPVMEKAFHPAFGEAWTEIQCRDMLSLPGSAMILGEVSSAIAGFALTRTVYEDCELMMIATHPKYQSYGIGGALLDHLVGHCRASGASKIHIEVRADNPALNFYTNKGCKVIGQRPNYYRRIDGGPTHAITLCLDISDA